MATLKTSAVPFVPQARTLPALREAIQACQGCDLYRHATQAVFGEIQNGATVETQISIMMIGEQPGDNEDKQGRPFVGPAGKLLDQCLEEAGIDRSKVYVTNTVKHFKWEPRGKLRIHQKPNMLEIRACRPWLEAELETVNPALIVCLGAVAAQSLLGSSFKVTQSHGELQQLLGIPPIIATLHPAAILRAATEQDRERDLKIFRDDLCQVTAPPESDHRPSVVAHLKGVCKRRRTSSWLYGVRGLRRTRRPELKYRKRLHSWLPALALSRSSRTCCNIESVAAAESGCPAKKPRRPALSPTVLFPKRAAK